MYAQVTLPQARVYSVYLITNTDNMRRYVGQTRQCLVRRFKQHMASPNKRMALDVWAVPKPDLARLFSIQNYIPLALSQPLMHVI